MLFGHISPVPLNKLFPNEEGYISMFPYDNYHMDRKFFNYIIEGIRSYKDARCYAPLYLYMCKIPETETISVGTGEYSDCPVEYLPAEKAWQKAINLINYSLDYWEVRVYNPIPIISKKLIVKRMRNLAHNKEYVYYIIRQHKKNNVRNILYCPKDKFKTTTLDCWRCEYKKDNICKIK